MKKLKIWNGRPHGKYAHVGNQDYHIYVAAHSDKHAAELVGKACNTTVSINEIRTYYSKNCWGDNMDGITPSEPCVYISDETKMEMINGRWKSPVKRVI